MSVFELFLKLPLFKGVELEELISLIPRIVLDFEDFQAGKTIFKKHDSPDGIYYLLKGRVALVSDGNSEEKSDNSLLSFTGLFGDDRTFVTDAIAIEDSHILTIDTKSLIYLLKSNTTILYNYLTLLSLTSEKGKCLEILKKL